MDYTSIFDPVPWDAVGHTVIQTLSIYWLVLLGLKLTGRRVFGEMGPQDLIILLLISESCDLGLANEKAGYWGTVASVLTILFMGSAAERIPFLRKFFEDRPITLFENGTINHVQMRKNMVEEGDLEKVAREYGQSSYQAFSRVILEGDGKLTGILKPGISSHHQMETKGVAG